MAVGKLNLSVPFDGGVAGPAGAYGAPIATSGGITLNRSAIGGPDLLVAVAIVGVLWYLTR